MTDEEIDSFHSDFRIVANFFAQKRRHADYIPNDKTEIDHVDELLKLLSAMTGDHRYEKILAEPNRKKVRNMCDVADRLVNKGKAEGRAEGISKTRIDFYVRGRRHGHSQAELVSEYGYTEEEVEAGNEILVSEIE